MFLLPSERSFLIARSAFFFIYFDALLCFWVHVCSTVLGRIFAIGISVYNFCNVLCVAYSALSIRTYVACTRAKQEMSMHSRKICTHEKRAGEVDEWKS